MWVKVPALEPQYQIVCDYTAPDESDCPLVILGQGNLNAKFAEGLKAAFEQPDCMLSAYADLANEDCKYTKETEQELTFETW